MKHCKTCTCDRYPLIVNVDALFFDLVLQIDSIFYDKTRRAR